MSKKNKSELKKVVRHYSFVYTKSKERKLNAVAKKYRAFRNELYKKYGGVECLPYLGNHRFTLSKQWAEDDSCDKHGLQGRQWKSALDEAFSKLLGKMEAAKTQVRSDMGRNKKFSNEEKHYVNYLLCFNNLLYKICKGFCVGTEKKFDIPEKRKEYLQRYLHGRLRKRAGGKPRSKSLSFTIDQEMYNTKKNERGDNWIAITSLKPYKQIKIKLTDNKPIKGTLRVKILRDRIEIIETQDVPCKNKTENTSESVIAIDKGLKNLVNSSSENKFGRNFGESLTKFSDRRSEKNKSRNKLRALYKKLLDKKMFKKAHRLLLHNLGTEKYDRIKEVERKELERQIGQALNEFFRVDNPHTLVTEDLSFQSWSKSLSRNQKRHFAEWLKGYLKKRLEFKCQQNGVLLAEVNAAYTSQTCPFCGYVHSDNRKGDKLHCLNCGKEGDADYFASLNILSRLDDPDINRYTPYREVKKILMERFEARRRNGGGTVETVQPRLQTQKWEGTKNKKSTRRPRCHSESELLSICG
jgi:IS605 OrfB family transposase